MREKLENIKNSALAQIDSADTLEEIENIKVQYLGRKGELNAIRRGVKDLSPEEKPSVDERKYRTRDLIYATFKLCFLDKDQEDAEIAQTMQKILVQY